MIESEISRMFYRTCMQLSLVLLCHAILSSLVDSDDLIARREQPVLSDQRSCYLT